MSDSAVLDSCACSNTETSCSGLAFSKQVSGRSCAGLTRRAPLARPLDKHDGCAKTRITSLGQPLRARAEYVRFPPPTPACTRRPPRRQACAERHALPPRQPGARRGQCAGAYQGAVRRARDRERVGARQGVADGRNFGGRRRASRGTTSPGLQRSTSKQGLPHLVYIVRCPPCLPPPLNRSSASFYPPPRARQPKMPPILSMASFAPSARGK